jgi:hypothetical protein
MFFAVIRYLLPVCCDCGTPATIGFSTAVIRFVHARSNLQILHFETPASVKRLLGLVWSSARNSNSQFLGLVLVPWSSLIEMSLAFRSP